MKRGRKPEGSASRPVVSDHHASSTHEHSRGPRHAYGAQPEAASPGIEKREDTTSGIGIPSWLMEAAADLSRDLDTSRKELDIINFVLEEIDLRSQSGGCQPAVGHAELMRACREYSSSRCRLLRERLRQVRSWLRIRGQQVPGEAPEEWRLVDMEWRRWLSDRASSHDADQLGGGDASSSLDYTSDLSNDPVWRLWGPLPHILSAEVWWKDL
ncbi:hypothetical protein F4802DRAFT_602454 [Xylaria palmicola]|nr:hypothetical protein F4802DRAFT_602454 [Xylaria palmicola]